MGDASDRTVALIDEMRRQITEGEEEIERLRAELQATRDSWAAIHAAQAKQTDKAIEERDEAQAKADALIADHAHIIATKTMRDLFDEVEARAERAESALDEAYTMKACAEATLKEEKAALRVRAERAESDRAALLAACEAMAAACKQELRNEHPTTIAAMKIERIQKVVGEALATYARARGEAAREVPEK